MSMNRREYLKSLFLAPLSGSIISSSGKLGAASNINWTPLPRSFSYGRTEAEKQTDAELFAENYFRENELLTIAILCDIILPNDHPNGGALDAGLPDFVEFMVKDRDQYKLPVRGGIAWLDSYAIENFGGNFINITEDQRLSICDEIAYPGSGNSTLQPGISFFSLMRNFTMTGYYTTEQGFKDLGYIGNTPNVWDGVPDYVLQKHGMEYNAEWISKCVDQSRKEIIAEWDDDGNLTT